MDYEKLYKESLEKAKSFAAKYVGDGLLISSEGSVAKEFNEIFPELLESEDEQHCKWILEYLYDGLRKSDEQFKDQFKSAIAWLEKQGEKTEPIEGFNTEFERQISHLIASTINKEYDYTKDFVKWTSDALLNYAKHELKEQGEQKPIEQDTEINDLWVYIKEWREKFGRLPKDEDELAACIDYVMKRQKPAEWSEEDKAILLSVKCVIDNVWHNSGLSDYDEKELQEMWEWLDEIWRRVEYPQPKQEWSEEDELAIERLVDTIEIARSFKYGKPKAVYTDEILDSLINWLKSLTPNHWKPSEEQLNEVKNAIGVTGTNGIVLLSLYNDIKKL